MEKQVRGGPHLQRIVDVDMVRTSTWRAKCAGWTISTQKMKGCLKNPCRPQDTRMSYQLELLEEGIRSSRISGGVSFEGRRVPITRKECELLFGINNEDGTFMAHSEMWHQLEKKTVALQNGESEGFDEHKRS